MEFQPGTEKREEYAYVLDFMATGKAYSGKAEPVVQLIGENWFTLLEATAKPSVSFIIGERTYIGSGERDKVSLIKGRISYDELTQTAKNGLINIILKIIRNNEQRFVNFFNVSPPLNIREHSLELLPGIGKKYLNVILAERAKVPFQSFKELEERVSLIQDPALMIAERVVDELKSTQRFYLFVKPYFPNTADHKYR
ncbi:MAG: DUF655 domain-containing protein [Candidatus Micrarchaeaceae archaeon]